MSSGSHRYIVVDVFTEKPLEGNALAVFPDARGIEESLLAKIARELNLSETVFVYPATRPDCAAKLRIFTPSRELAFAGHPTVGAAWVLREEGLVAKKDANFALEEPVGPVPVRIDAGTRPLIWLRTPPIQFGQTFDRKECAAALGLSPSDLAEADPQLVTAGNPTVFLPLKTKEAVDRASLEMAGMRKLKGAEEQVLCVFVFAPMVQGAYARMFAPEHGIIEDPATGSSTGPLAAYMLRFGLLSGERRRQFVSEQGTKMGRRSFLHVQMHGNDGAEGIDVGGYVTPIAEATMRLS
ncbi:MAG TPA: PhzF family phenazine biosynthesis protein [Acidobacteriaceae bacterium]|jgi:trans-2,3-dihydro-3-hydroxyanthranilate isomerase|nr:PhzF family phenazine biosynthesis protein [Acidobacteriaceae bacterium]